MRNSVKEFRHKLFDLARDKLNALPSPKNYYDIKLIESNARIIISKNRLELNPYIMTTLAILHSIDRPTERDRQSRAAIWFRENFDKSPLNLLSRNEVHQLLCYFEWYVDGKDLSASRSPYLNVLKAAELGYQSAEVMLFNEFRRIVVDIRDTNHERAYSMAYFAVETYRKQCRANEYWVRTWGHYLDADINIDDRPVTLEKLQDQLKLYW